MDTLLPRTRIIQVFKRGIGSSFFGVLNFLLFLAILISLFTNYVYVGLALVLIISSVQIWLGIQAYERIRSPNISYRILEAVTEWYPDEGEKTQSKKLLRILLTQTVNSICYYLEPGERVKEVKGALALYSNKICTDIPPGYTPVELIFKRFFPQGTEIEIELFTEKEKSSQPSLVSFYTHNNPQRVSMIINVKADNDNYPKATVQYFKGGHKKVMTEPNVKVIREKSCAKIVWESDELIGNAIYNMTWSNQ